MAFDVVVPLVARLEEISAARSVRAVILSGAGRGFCSGADQSGEKGRMPGIEGHTAVSVARKRHHPVELLVRLLTGNFEEAVAAREEKRSPHFRD